MSKVLAMMIAGLFAFAAHAQNPKAPEQGSPPDPKAVSKAEAKRATKPQGQVKETGGPKNDQTGAIGTDKSAMAGEKRAQTRDDRRRAKDGSVKPKSTQGVTPDAPGAK